ncbi:GMC family oxidoreductase [Streptomyces globisporus]|uniref:Cholesterol oxidase n=2 Tax=Streptomyces globisporus TaxID=1908 RepID=Q8GME7_STRGL|nr:MULTISPECIES: GMC family oxidoreductase [Streptomyces]PPA38222.1 glucose-methanol-choline oxidoreductase [Streptomyces griseus]RAN13404.1 glucose-methanol-choline oxidoreductase [Streptomyces badius]AAL06693.1 oxidoreductase [Streptomyces globisporus]ALU98455.1 glucose-methanol-choline oxidoreductase [Streptomyces globisporus C-1027]AWL90756.1 GMC family oxidoreductase [Streptomyces globisporus]
MSTTAERTDVLVIGSGFGGAIAAYHLAAGGADVTVLERGPWLESKEFEHDYKLGSSYTRAFDFTVGDGMSILGGNCVGGGSVVYFAAMPRAPRFVFDRQGSIGRRMWPQAVSRETLDPWYDRVEESLSVTRQDWNDVSYAGGLWAAACNHAGRTANPLAVAIDNTKCVNCNWMMAGCRFEAKQSLLVNYLPAAIAHGARIRPLHEVQHLSRTPDGSYRVHYNVVHDDDYRLQAGSGVIEAKIVVMAAGAGATPVILQRSEAHLGTMPRAVGRYFSGNGERLNTAIIDEAKAAELFGLDRGDGLAYAANQIGKGPTVASWDRLDGSLPEYSRYSLEQLYFPPGLGTILAQVPGATGPSWFGKEKKEILKQWTSWLTIFTMIEDDNEGVFGPPPATGNAHRISQQMLGRGNLRYDPTKNTLGAWAASDAEVKEILEKDGLAKVMPWTNDLVGAYTVHPLSSCRMGDDPHTSALDDSNELRDHPGIFVTDGSSVPGALTVNPAMTIAALAERAMPGIVRAAQSRGISVTYGAPAPDGSTSGRERVLPLLPSARG